MDKNLRKTIPSCDYLKKCSDVTEICDVKKS